MQTQGRIQSGGLLSHKYHLHSEPDVHVNIRCFFTAHLHNTAHQQEEGKLAAYQLLAEKQGDQWYILVLHEGFI